jgi:hypothetical protein
MLQIQYQQSPTSEDDLFFINALQNFTDKESSILNSSFEISKASNNKSVALD